MKIDEHVGHRGSRHGRGRSGTVEAGGGPVVYLAAAVGAVLLVFELYILVKWAVGPNFKAVPYGPSEPPGWMKASIVIWQPVASVLTLWCFYRFIVRPWRRERQVPLYGLMSVSLFLASVYDPVGSYFHNWYAYNAYFLNFGSPLPGGLPGWQGFAEPGAMIAWSIIFLPTLYVLLFMFTTWAGVTLMGTIRRRIPRLPGVALLGVAYVVILLIDILAEGTIMMRLGWYAETGLSLNEGEYYQLPWRNALLATLMFTALAGLAFFRNERGQTVVERGVERFRGGAVATVGLRFLAVLAAVQLIVLLTFQVPMALYEKHKNGHWPESISGKSYLNDHICGFDTPRACP